MAKRLICVIISVLMIVSLLPSGVFAAGGTDASSTGEITGASIKTQDVNEKEEPELDYGIAVIDDDVTSSAAAEVGDTSYTSLSAAISAASAGDTVTLLDNVSESSVTVSKNLTIDLNGKTLSTSYVYVGTSGVEVTVKNGTITGTYGAYVTAGTLTLDSCTLSLTDAAYAYGGELKLVSTTLTSTTTNRAINCYDSSTVTIGTDSTVNCESGTGVVIWGDGSGETAKTPTLNVYGKINAYVCVSGNGTDYSGTKINLYSGAVLTASGLGMYLPQPCTVNITGATVTGLAAIGIKSGTLNITGAALIQGTGSYDADLESTSGGINADGSAIVIDSYSGYAGDVTVNIYADEDGNSPTISSTNAVAIREISNSVSTNVVSISISAGTVTSGDGLDAISVTEAAEDYVSVIGGSYSSDVSAYTTSTSAAVATTDENGNTTYEVVETVEGAVAVVYDEDENLTGSYITLKAAASAASNGGKVVLVADITSTTVYAASNDLTLDLAGHSLSVTSGYALQISQYASGMLTIMDSVGTGIIKSTAKTALYVGASSLNIVVNGGNFESTAYDIYNGGTGTVTITGGTFTSGSYAIKNASTGAIVISGGYYSDYHTLSSYLADGYAVGDQITDTDSDYYNMYPVVAAAFVVSYSYNNESVTSSCATLYQAWNALSSEYTDIVVTMNSDSEQYFKVDSNISATLDLNGYSIEYSGNAVQVYGSLIIKDSSDEEEGTITSSSTSSGVSAVHVYEGGSVTVEEGTVSGRIAVLTESTGTAYVTGGNVGGNLSGSVTVSGGNFYPDPSSYVATGYCVVDSGVETYVFTVVKVELGASSGSSTVAATSISGYSTSTLYVGVSNSDNTYTTTNYPTTSLTYTDDDGVTHSYIFAGWYEDSTGTTACTEVPSGEAYAKFVDENVMKLYCVFTPSSVTGSGNFWRFVSSLDVDVDGSYQIVLTNSDGNTVATIDWSKMRYTNGDYTLTSIGRVFNLSTDFGSASNYIVTGSYTDSDSTYTSITATVQWTKADGTCINGSSYTFSVGSDPVTTTTELTGVKS